MSGKAAKVMLTEKQQDVPQQLSRSTIAPRRIVQRATIILLAFSGWLNEDIAGRINLARKQVGLWRRRWQQSFEALVAIECRETNAALRRAIEDVLSDAQRDGSTGTFTAEQVTQILRRPANLPNNPVGLLTVGPIANWPMKSSIAGLCRPSR